MSKYTPTPKVAAGGYAGAAALVLVWLLGQFGVDMPPEVAAALALLAYGGAAYLKRDRTSPEGCHAAE